MLEYDSGQPAPKPTHFAFPLELMPVFQALLVQALRGSTDLQVYETVKRLESGMRQIVATANPMQTEQPKAPSDWDGIDPPEKAA